MVYSHGVVLLAQSGHEEFLRKILRVEWLQGKAPKPYTRFSVGPFFRLDF